jgi:hypothetical protein
MSAPVDKMYPLTQEHFTVFGRIIHQFAIFERLVEINIHNLCGGKTMGLTALIISGLGYTAKSDVLLSLLDVMIIDRNEKTAPQIKTLVSEFNGLNPLRNNIAHHSWTRGKRDGSVKPISISTRSGKLKFKGVNPEDDGYTLSELSAISDNLARIHEELRSLMASIGHFPSAESPSSGPSPSP